jgi:HTH-type transcriptional regulator / antitoxin HigA
MPTATYEQLLAETVPEVILNEGQYHEISSRFGDLVGKGRARSNQETKLMRLLAVLIEDYDRRYAMPPSKSTPAERLRFLLEHAAKKPSDLITVFGQRSHVNEALNGRREISLDKARKLAKLFGVKPGVFL